MDHYNDHILNECNAKAHLLLDANVLIYAQQAYEAIGVHLLDYLDRLDGLVNWYVASGVVMNLHNRGTYNMGQFFGKMLNCSDIGMKMDQFPYIKNNGDLAFVRLNKLAGDDWA